MLKPSDRIFVLLNIDNIICLVSSSLVQFSSRSNKESSDRLNQTQFRLTPLQVTRAYCLRSRFCDEKQENNQCSSVEEVVKVSIYQALQVIKPGFRISVDSSIANTSIQFIHEHVFTQ